MTNENLQRRSGCPINYGLEVFGDRWTLLVLRDLLIHGKRRFGEMLDSEEAIATNVLSDRLQRLESLGIVNRIRDDNDRRQYIYTPTEKGRGLLRVLLEIAAWGATHDAKTAAPPNFAREFYADPESIIARHLLDD